MAKINLLPWREWERERRRTEFLTRLGVVLLLGVAIVFVAGFVLDTRVERQNKRNEFLSEHIAQLDLKIAEIRTLRTEREQLLARMRVIQDLQGNRPVIVRIFDELVRTLAQGVHYDAIKMDGTTLSVHGIAESNNRISALMRNLDGSEWFASPNLKSIKEDTANPDYGPKASSFDLTFVQVNPNTAKEAE